MRPPHPTPPPGSANLWRGLRSGPSVWVGMVSGGGARGLESLWERGRPKALRREPAGPPGAARFPAKARFGGQRTPRTPILACGARARLSFRLCIRWALCFRRVGRAVEVVSRHLLLPAPCTIPRVPALPARRCPRICWLVFCVPSHAEWEWLGVGVVYPHACCKALTLGGACLVIHCVSVGPGQPFYTHVPPPKTPDLQVIPSF